MENSRVIDGLLIQLYIQLLVGLFRGTKIRLLSWKIMHLVTALR